MPRFAPMGGGVLRLEERHPLLSVTGRRTLTQLIESPSSPAWNHHCGDRLDATGRARVQALAALAATDPPRWAPAGGRPPWLPALVERTARSVPRYRKSGATGEPPFTTSRHDLLRAWWELVPDDADLDELIWYPTSGCGHPPVVVPTHPVAVSCYYPLLLAAAAWSGVVPRFRPERADWITVVSQAEGGFTVPSWSSVLDCATAKVNLRSGWRGHGDRERFLERHDPAVITGDPVSLGQLADLDVSLHPMVIFSTALHLSSATRERVQARLGCPVIDVYSSTESGPIAADRPGGGMALLQPRMFVEVVDPDGMPCPPGTPGTVALTGGMNPYLPLLRYRTGDTATLAWSGDQPVLHRLSGRAIVTLRSATGGDVSSLDVSQVLEELPLRQWALRQRADGSVTIAVTLEAGAAVEVNELIASAVHRVLGPVPVAVEALPAADKVASFNVEQPA